MKSKLLRKLVSQARSLIPELEYDGTHPIDSPSEAADRVIYRDLSVKNLRMVIVDGIKTGDLSWAFREVIESSDQDDLSFEEGMRFVLFLFITSELS